jgi:hypothetical protein
MGLAALVGIYVARCARLGFMLLAALVRHSAVASLGFMWLAALVCLGFSADDEVYRY